MMFTRGDEVTEKARMKMVRAIDEYEITGVKTTLSFCRFVMTHESFASGKFDTGFVGEFFKPEMLDNQEQKQEEVAALISAFVEKSNSQTVAIAANSTSKSNWKRNRIRSI